MKWTDKLEDNTIVLNCVLPGFEKDNINVSIEDGYMCVEAVGTDKSLYDTTVKYFKIPSKVDFDSIHAEFKNGVLEVRMPLLVKKEKIKVN